MKHLYAPWRSGYLHNKQTGSCVFCKNCAETDDAQTFIIKRFEHCFVMLNLFPYNAGHLLIIPYEHQDSLEKLSQPARQEMMEVATKSITILKETLGAEAINIGLNLGGKAAGGSIPDHLHMHVLPRWLGDTNFLVTLADTKQISIDLADTYRKLSTASW